MPNLRLRLGRPPALLPHRRSYATPAPHPAPPSTPSPPPIPTPTASRRRRTPSPSSTSAGTPTPTPKTKPSPQPYIHPAPPGTRVFPPRKAFSYKHYAQLVRAADLVLLLGHDGFSANALAKLRRDVVRALRPPAAKPKSGSGPAEPPTDVPPQATLHVIRPAIFASALRAHAPALYPVRPLLRGPIAALVYPTLDPPVLAALLRVLDRATTASANAQAQFRAQLAQGGGGGGAGAGGAGGDAAKKAQKPPPRLELLAALAGGEIMSDARLRAAAKLPTLDTLRAQIVGLLSAPAAQLGGVLDQARGGRAVRLLRSYAEPEPQEGAEEKTA